MKNKQVWLFFLCLFPFTQIYSLKLIINVPRNTPENDSIYITGDSFETCKWIPNCLKLKPLGHRSFEIDVHEKNTRLKFKITRGNWDTEAADSQGQPLADLFIQASSSLQIINLLNWKDNAPIGVSGNIVSWNDIYSPELDNHRDIFIWLPPSYLNDTSQDYPVIYVQDGQNIFDPDLSSMGLDWGIDEAMTDLIKRKVVREAIVVGVSSTHDREKEYDYSNKGMIYGKFLIDTLKPLIDSNFRTKKDRQNTFLLGSSMGALISVALAWNRPDIFSRAAGISFAAMFKGENIYHSVMASNFPKIPIQLYIDHGGVGGDKTYEKYVSRFYEKLTTWGFPKNNLSYQKFPYSDHHEAAWSRRSDIFLKFLLK